MPLAHRRRRLPERWKRLPLRIRLIAGFAAAMLVVLAAAGTFVYFRVEYALDLRLNEDLAAQSTQLAQSVPAHAAPALTPGTSYQLLDAGNHVLSASTDLAGVSLLRPDEAAAALHRPVLGDRGNLFAIDSHTLRLYAVPLDTDATPPAGQAAVALSRSTVASGTRPCANSSASSASPISPRSGSRPWSVTGSPTPP